jgi:hypothetical protein
VKSRGLLGAISIVFVVGGLTACGGSDSGDSTSGTASSDEAAAKNGSLAAGNGARSGTTGRSDVKGDKGNGSSSSAKEETTAKKASFKKFKVAPLRVSGGGSKQFISKGGDNSIQEYGEESGDTELTEAAEALHNYYVAFSHDDWATACSYLSKSVRSGLEQLSSRSEGGSKLSCPELSAKLYVNRSSAARRELTIVDAVSLRREGDQAFLMYRGAEYDTGNAYGPSDLYAMTMRLEDGQWKMGLTVGTQLGIPKNLPENAKP